jgi:hypothetical protein
MWKKVKIDAIYQFIKVKMMFVSILIEALKNYSHLKINIHRIDNIKRLNNMPNLLQIQNCLKFLRIRKGDIRNINGVEEFVNCHVFRLKMISLFFQLTQLNDFLPIQI